MTNRFLRVLLVGFAGLAACATPIAPTGGPPDETPPEVVESLPQSGAVDVRRETLTITFSKHIDQATFAQAFSITPAFEGRPEFRWSGRTVEVRFPEPLRENTTYVVTIDTNLRDQRRVALRTPITLAFSTGPTITRGTLSGRVLGARTGSPAAAVDVFAYALDDSIAPASLPARPDYRTQTDQNGSFRLDHLTEQFYFVAALNDLNRNLAPDPLEAFAPPPVPAILADTTPVAIAIPWVLARIDSVRPDPLRIQSHARARHSLWASEPVYFTDRRADAWVLTDSVTGQSVPIEDVYLRAGERRQVFFTTPDLEPGTYGLTATGLADTSGNPINVRTIYFIPSASPDTLRVRFVDFLPERPAENDAPRMTLARDVTPGIRFNAPVTEEVLAKAVTVRDSLDTPLAFSAVTRNGTDYEIWPDSPPPPGSHVEIRVDDAPFAGRDTVYRFAFERLPASETGELSGTVARAEGVPVVVEAHPQDVDLFVPVYRTRVDASDRFIFYEIPAGTYRLRAFEDRNEDGEWDGGLLSPYRRPAGIAWSSETARVRARWETSLPDTLRIPTTP